MRQGLQADSPACSLRTTMRAMRCIDRIVLFMDAQEGRRRGWRAGGSGDLGGKGLEVMR